MGHTTCTISVYLETKSSLLLKINALEVLIDKMLLRIAESVDGQAAVLDEYWMDDGQMKVKTIFRSIDQLEKGIKGLIKLKNLYQNQFNGRGMVLRDVRGIY